MPLRERPQVQALPRGGVRQCRRLTPIAGDVPDRTIAVRRDGDGYRVSIGAGVAGRAWASPRPLSVTEAIQALWLQGCEPEEIEAALDAAAPGWRGVLDAGG